MQADQLCENILKYISNNVYIIIMNNPYLGIHNKIMNVCSTQELANEYTIYQISSELNATLAKYIGQKHCFCKIIDVGTDIVIMHHKKFYKYLIDKYQLEFSSCDNDHKLITVLNVNTMKRMVLDCLNKIENDCKNKEKIPQINNYINPLNGYKYNIKCMTVNTPFNGK